MRIRAKPSSSAAIIATLSYDVVSRGKSETQNEAWEAIILPSGKHGYVASEFVRGPCNWRATFEKKAGKWLMTTYIKSMTKG